MQNLQPQVEAIRERYKDDTERLNVEINRLYEENQVSPLAGCLPLMLTLPVVWGLYRRSIMLQSMAPLMSPGFHSLPGWAK